MKKYLPMHNASNMQIFESKHYLSYVLPCPFFRETTKGFDHCRAISAVQVHHKVKLSLLWKVKSSLATKGNPAWFIRIIRSALTLVTWFFAIISAFFYTFIAQ